MSRKRAIDAHASTDRDFQHWKGRFKAAAMAFEQGKLEEARTLMFRSLFEGEGLSQRDFAIPACNLGIAIVSMEQGKTVESREYFDKSISALANQSDSASQELYAAGLRFLAMWHDRSGDLDESKRCLRESVRILTDLGTDSAVQLAHSLCDLSYMLVKTGQIDEAESLIVSAMEILKGTVGRDDPEYDWAKMIYQVCLSQNDRELLAETLEVSATQLQYKVGSRNPNLIRAVNAFAAGLKKDGMEDRLEKIKVTFSTILRS